MGEPPEACPTSPSVSSGPQTSSATPRCIAARREPCITLCTSPQLKRIPDPPPLLHVRGDLSCVAERDCIAIVGTREPSKSAYMWAKSVGRLLATEGATVVSGLARGCDTAGHQGSLMGGGPTVAVLAHGLHTIFPPENQELAEVILANGGCLVSEYSWGKKPGRNTFVARDRLQSGLSRAVIVVETDVKGGTMHTVEFCEKQGRILGCLQHSDDEQPHAKQQGNELLLSSRRARPLQTKEDVSAFLRIVRAEIDDPWDASRRRGPEQLPGLVL
jgi:DNA processing protein